MKIVFILLFLAPAIITNGQIISDHGLNADTPFEISGVIKHYEPEGGKNFIRFRTSNIAGELKDTSLPIDGQGHFNAKLWQPFAGDITFLYRQRFVVFYATPGEKIGLEIDGDTWPENENPLQSIKITGPSAAISRSIIDFQYKMASAGLRNTPYSPDIPDERYASQRIEDMKQHLAFLKQ